MGLILEDGTHIMNHWPERLHRRKKLEETLPAYSEYISFAVGVFAELAKEYPDNELIKGICYLAPTEMRQNSDELYQEFLEGL